jgi:hypothetical protein
MLEQVGEARLSRTFVTGPHAKPGLVGDHRGRVVLAMKQFESVAQSKTLDVERRSERDGLHMLDACAG